MGCEDNHKVLCATYILKGNASHWWEMTSRAKNRNGWNGVTWDRFKQLFDDKYFPGSSRMDKEVECMQLTQGSMSLMEYEQKFKELSRFAPHLIDTEERKALVFERGLRLDLKRIVSIFKLKTYSAMLQKAQLYAKDEVVVIAPKLK